MGSKVSALRLLLSSHVTLGKELNSSELVLLGNNHASQGCLSNPNLLKDKPGKGFTFLQLRSATGLEQLSLPGP